MTETERQAEQFEYQHTLGEPTDPNEVDHPDAYQEQGGGETVLIDPAKAVLVQGMRSCLVNGPEGELGIAFQLQGRVGPEGTKVAITQVASLEGVGRMVGQLIELAISSGEAPAKAFNEAMSDEMMSQVENHQAFTQSRQHP